MGESKVQKLRIVKQEGEHIEEYIKVLKNDIRNVKLYVVKGTKGMSVVDLQLLKDSISRIAGHDDEMIVIPESGDISVYSFELIED